MECRYCQAANADDDHRCRRCGRRLRMGPVYTGSSAAAPVLQYELRRFAICSAGACVRFCRAGPESQADAPLAEPSAPRRPITYQPSLFTSRELPLVVRFDTIAPSGRPVQPAPRKPQPSAPRQRRRKVIPGQQALEFTHQFAQSARSSKPADGVIYCDAPVAIPAHRAMAAALDASIIVMALAVFGIVFHLAGGAFVLNAKTAPMFLGAAAGVVIFYDCCGAWPTAIPPANGGPVCGW